MTCVFVYSGSHRSMFQCDGHPEIEFTFEFHLHSIDHQMYRLVDVKLQNNDLFTRVIERHMNAVKDSCNVCLLNTITILVNCVGIGVPPLLNEPYDVVKSTFSRTNNNT